MWSNCFRLAHERNKNIEIENNMDEFLENMSRANGGEKVLKASATAECIVGNSNPYDDSYALATFVQQCGKTCIEATLESICVVPSDFNEQQSATRKDGYPGKSEPQNNESSKARQIVNLVAPEKECESDSESIDGDVLNSKPRKNEKKKRKIEIAAASAALDSSDSELRKFNKKQKKNRER